MNRRGCTITGCSPLAQWVAQHARRQQLFQPGSRILVALSGGPDSVALLSVLKELAPAWRLGLTAMHINHGLRGEESEEDARFAAELCDRLEIGLRSVRVAPDRHGPAGKRSSLQERAREARYAALAAEAKAVGADRIALGHQADDQAETLLMWMLRGAGTTGLAGIPPIREALVIRPLLGVPRAEILDYLRQRTLAFRTDSSNAKPIYLRNRIRRDIMPVLKDFNPSIVEGLVRQAEVLKEEDAYLHQQASIRLGSLTRERSDGSVTVERAGLLALPLALQRRVVRLLFRRINPAVKGPSFTVVEGVLKQVAQGRTGASLTAQGVAVTGEYEAVCFQSAGLPFASKDQEGRVPVAGLILDIPSSLTWTLTGQTLNTVWDHQSMASGPSNRGPCRNTAVLDADRFTAQLRVRSWQPGDAFQPAGMRGRTKKLQDYFSDIKLPRQARHRVPLIVAPEGILWVVGHRTDHRFSASAEAKRRLILTVSDHSLEGGAD
jgi:tRNA(Ile)-lysidine synthase